MRRSALILPIGISIAACGSEEPEIQATNASVEEVAEQVREATAGEQFIRPGKWVSQVRFEEMSAPGIPERTERQVNDMLSETQTFESCLTEEQTRKPGEDFFTGADNQCRYDNFTMGHGKINASMRCSQGNATQQTQMEGSYSPDSYQLRMTSSVAGIGGGKAGEMRVRMRIDAKRVGECSAADSAAKQGQGQEQGR